MECTNQRLLQNLVRFNQDYESCFNLLDRAYKPEQLKKLFGANRCTIGSFSPETRGHFSSDPDDMEELNSYLKRGTDIIIKGKLNDKSAVYQEFLNFLKKLNLNISK